MRKKAASKVIFPNKAIIDTNVPKIANQAVDPNTIPDDLLDCVGEAVRAIKWFIKQPSVIVLDEKEEILAEYRRQLSPSGQPGPGDRFLKWILDHYETCERVPISRDGDDGSYKEFPKHEGLEDFDPADRKFVAVANAHPEHPPILEGTDSKWWGWKDALNEVGIRVIFLDKKYVADKWKQKMGS